MTDYRFWQKRFEETGGWGPAEEKRLVRYRRSSNGIYQEVWLEPNGHYFYGYYMPEGFVPPAHLEEA